MKLMCKCEPWHYYLFLILYCYDPKPKFNFFIFLKIFFLLSFVYLNWVGRTVSCLVQFF